MSAIVQDGLDIRILAESFGELRDASSPAGHATAERLRALPEPLEVAECVGPYDPFPR